MAAPPTRGRTRAEHRGTQDDGQAQQGGRESETRSPRDGTMRWSPIEDLAPDAESWDEDLYRRARERWSKARGALQSKDVDQTALHLWTAERHRLFAIETGQIENLYTLKRGMTEMLVTEGLENAHASHTIEGVLSDRTLRGLLEDQHDAMEMVFQSVTDERPLSQSAIKEWHALLTRHQDTTPGRDTLGRRIGIPFVKGAYKRRLNNPRTPDGSIHEYLPARAHRIGDGPPA